MPNLRSSAHRASLAITLALAVLAAGCGSSSHSTTSTAPRRAAVQAPVEQPIVGTPAVHPESSEALAGHPTKAATTTSGCTRHPVEQQITTPTWLSGFEITEYFPTPESWFSGRKVTVPGLPGPHRVDWLYSSSGVAMEGEGVGLDGRYYGIDRTGGGGWVTRAGALTLPGSCASHWSRGAPLWFAGGWRNAAGQVTFPLERGGWSNGTAARTVSYQGVTFAERHAPTARPYYTVAVDSQLIPQGSRIYIPAYKGINGGWFVAGDTGGGIIGHHIDVYRTPTASINDGGRYLTDQRVYVIPPH